MKQKILSFITRDGKWLAVHSKKHPKHGAGGWFVVTGEIENGESLEAAVKREIKEETGVDTLKVFALNWGSIYEWWNELCEEMNFIAFVKSGRIELNEEHDTYEWLDLESFVERINWNDDKKLLKKVLETAINKKKYFSKKKMTDYR